MRIILDTNVFVAALIWQGVPAKIVDACKRNEFTLIVSEEILQEYKIISIKLSKKYKSAYPEMIFDELLANAEIYSPTALPEPICRDPDDDKFIACALASGAKLIVSGDKDLLVLSGYADIEILKPADFVNTYLS